MFGCGLDLAVALLNHNCEPNVGVSFEKGRFKVRSLRPIRAGEELMRTYVDCSMDVLTRWDKLQNIHLFTCECESY